VTRRAIILVLDGVGIGEAHDAAAYGDTGSNTLGSIARVIGGLQLPHLEALGLGSIAPVAGIRADAPATGAWGAMQPASAGKDSTAGHWEIAGLRLDRPFPTYPTGFPPDVVRDFERWTRRSVIGNISGSGTEVIARFADEHVSTGGWILYTSADSVFQVAAHEEVIPLGELYLACRRAREILVPPHDVSRVIARPFAGVAGAWRRTENRRDFSLPPTGPTLLDALQEAGIPRAGVGKVDDLFAGRGVSSEHTASNAVGLRRIAEWIRSDAGGLLFANLVDFDQLYGHRNDVMGFYRSLRELDDALPNLLSGLRDGDLMFITADHGNDPTTASTDHARERVPLLATGHGVRPVSIGERSTFSDLGASVADWLGIAFRGQGTSFLSEIMA
jgi:phosphopentomutase